LEEALDAAPVLPAVAQPAPSVSALPPPGGSSAVGVSGPISFQGGNFRGGDTHITFPQRPVVVTRTTAVRGRSAMPRSTVPSARPSTSPDRLDATPAAAAAAATPDCDVAGDDVDLPAAPNVPVHVPVQSDSRKKVQLPLTFDSSPAPLVPLSVEERLKRVAAAKTKGKSWTSWKAALKDFPPTTSGSQFLWARILSFVRYAHSPVDEDICQEFGRLVNLRNQMICESRPFTVTAKELELLTIFLVEVWKLADTTREAWISKYSLRHPDATLNLLVSDMNPTAGQKRGASPTGDSQEAKRGKLVEANLVGDAQPQSAVRVADKMDVDETVPRQRTAAASASAAAAAAMAGDHGLASAAGAANIAGGAVRAAALAGDAARSSDAAVGIAPADAARSVGALGVGVGAAADAPLVAPGNAGVGVGVGVAVRGVAHADVADDGQSPGIQRGGIVLNGAPAMRPGQAIVPPPAPAAPKVIGAYLFSLYSAIPTSIISILLNIIFCLSTII